jgi:hypothetical protein
MFYSYDDACPKGAFRFKVTGSKVTGGTLSEDDDGLCACDVCDIDQEDDDDDASLSSDEDDNDGLLFRILALSDLLRIVCIVSLPDFLLPLTGFIVPLSSFFDPLPRFFELPPSFALAIRPAATF